MFIHDALDEYITCGDTSISVTNLRVSVNSLSMTKSGKTINGFQEQFVVRGDVHCSQSGVVHV